MRHFLLALISAVFLSAPSYADPQLAPEASNNPALYVCSKAESKENLYVLVSIKSGDFALFNNDGAYVNEGVFALKEASDGTPYLYAEINGSMLGFVKKVSGFYLIISTGTNVISLKCK